MPQLMVRHRFSVDDYEQMIERKILTEEDRVELIHGEIIDKMPIGPKHAATVNKSTNVFARILGEKVIVSSQNPVHLADSQPEPDITLLRPRADFYASKNPQPKDVLLLTEVSDSSLDFDREVKLPMYAQAGIVEFWLINLAEDTLTVHRQPTPEGEYRWTQTYRRGQTVEIEAFPGVIFAVDQLI